MTLLERLNAEDRFARSIGARLTEVREGYSCADLTVEERHLNGAGVCQGGVIYTLADLAFAAVNHPVLGGSAASDFAEHPVKGRNGVKTALQCHLGHRDLRARE